MKKISILLCFIFSGLVAQNSTNYFITYYPIINKAELSYIDGNYQEAFDFYQKAFERAEPLRWDLVEAAKTALKLQKNDLTVSYLLQAFTKGTSFKYIRRNKNFAGLNSNDWQILKKDYKSKRNKFINNINFELRKEIEKMRKIDQKYRKKSNKYDIHYEIQNSLDSLNIVRLKQMIQKYGFLEEKLIGINKNQEKSKLWKPNYFIILLHCHSTERTEYFIPLLIENAKKGLCSPHLAALLFDQTALYNGQLQKYGTYNCKNKDGKRTPCEIADETKIDSLRASIGLEPFRDYLKKNNLEYEFKQKK